MIKSDILRKKSNIILGSDVTDELINWYINICKDVDARYTVFVVRRSYMLALILESISGYQMKDIAGEKEYLTDAAFFLRMPELEEFYRNKGFFPRIVICDDILIHGRNVNHFLEWIENDLISRMFDINPDQIRNALQHAISIKVYTKSDRWILLNPRYAENLYADRIEEPEFWRKLSGNISTLILNADMVNASYIISEKIPSNIIERLNMEPGWIKTNYQGVVEYALILNEKEINRVYYISTIRVILQEDMGSCRVVPFVFIPNLSNTETINLWQKIKQRISVDFQKRIELWYRIEGKRSFSEWLSLFFSYTVLKKFNEKYDIKVDEESLREEYQKLSRNYNAINTTDTISFLKWTFEQKQFDMQCMNDILMDQLRSVRYLFDLNNEADDNNAQVVKYMEDVLYNQAYRDEKNAFELCKEHFLEEGRRSVRNVDNCFSFIRQICDGHSEPYVRREIAYLLQMMDNGIMSLSSFASKNIRVVGMAQFQKCGEQSLAILPRRYYLYIPLLNKVEQRCIHTNKKFEIELSNFLDSKYCNIERTTKDELYKFMIELHQMGQTAGEWLGQHFNKVDSQGYQKNISDFIKFLNRQNIYELQYMEYINAQSY